MRKMWLVSLLVVGLFALAAMSFAQPPGGGPGGPGRGGPGGGMMGGMMGGPAFGTIWLVGDKGTSLALESPFPGVALVSLAQLDANTKLTEYVDCDVAQIKVGDVITVAGTPRKVRADDVQVGGPVAQVLMPPAQPNGPPMPDLLAPSASGRLTGKVTATQPLTVDVNGIAIEIETAAKTSIIKQQPLASAEGLKKGQKVIVIGERGNTGVMTARLLIVDSTAANGLLGLFLGGGAGMGPGMGMGMGMGFGGPGGFGGFGGPGGRGPGGGPPMGGGPPAGGGPLPRPAGAQ